MKTEREKTDRSETHSAVPSQLSGRLEAAQQQCRRKYRPRRRLTIGPLGMLVPLLNVLLLFCLFLILHSHIVLRPGISVQLPQAEFIDGSQYNTMVLIMTQEGLIFFNDERIPIDGLAFALSQAAHSHQDMALTIEADLRVQYGMVVRIMNMAVAAGIRNIHLAARPAFSEEVMP